MDLLITSSLLERNRILGDLAKASYANSVLPGFALQFGTTFENLRYVRQSSDLRRQSRAMLLCRRGLSLLSSLACSSDCRLALRNSCLRIDDQLRAFAEAPKTPDEPAKLMQSIGRRYVQYINRTYRRSGTLWDGRFKSSAIQTEEYLLLCQRYIELNPVRAGMVDDPAQYYWSSYRHNGLGQDDRQLTHHSLYESLGRDQNSSFRHTGNCFVPN